MNKYAEYKEAYKAMIKEAISASKILEAAQNKINRGTPIGDIRKRLRNNMDLSIEDLNFARNFGQSQYKQIFDYLQPYKHDLKKADIGRRLYPAGVNDNIMLGYIRKNMADDLAEKNFDDLMMRLSNVTYEVLPTLINTRRNVLDGINKLRG